MNILIESLGIQHPGGPRTVVLNLFHEIFRIDTENTYTVLLTQPEPRLDFPNGHQIIYPIQNRFLARIYLQTAILFLAPRFDLIHFTKNLGVLGLRTPHIITLHDMTTLFVPEIFPRSDFFYWRYVEKYTLRSAKRIITVSNAAANDITQIYKIPLDKIDVIYHGNSGGILPAGPEEIQRIRQTYQILDPYIICVGRIDPKKNLTAVVKGFHQFKLKRNFPGKLVLVGEIYRKKPDVHLLPTIKNLGLENDVILTGKVPNEDIGPLYSGAFCSVFASLHEGFGLVALEALSCGVPLITAQAGAVGEVVGDSAIVLSDPNPALIAESLVQLLDHPEMRDAMIQKGFNRAKFFSWENAAAKTLEVYQKCWRKS